MNKQFNAMLLTYTTRWGVWGVVLLFAATCLFLAASERKEYRPGRQFSLKSLNTISIYRFETAQETQRDQPVDIHYGELGDDLRRLLLSTEITQRTPAEIDRELQALLSKFTRIEKLDVSMWSLSEPLIGWISTLSTLRELRISLVNGHPVDLSLLARLPQLEVLELYANAPQDAAIGLSKFTQLRRLRLETPLLFTTPVLADIAQLPRLRILEFSYSGVGRFDIQVQKLSVLREAPMLREVGLGSTWDDTTDLVAVQAQLPNVNVRAMLYRTDRVFAFLGVCFFGVMLLSAPLLIPIAQFSSPLAALAPGYQRAGLRVVASWVVVGIACAVVTVMSQGGHLLPTAAGLSCAFLSWGPLFVPRSQGQETPTRWERVPAAVRLLLILPLFFAPMWLMQQSLLVDAYVTGNMPWLTAAFAFGAAACGWRLRHLLLTLCRRSHEAGITSPDTLVGWQQSIQRQQLLTAERNRKAVQIDPFRRLDSVGLVMGIVGLLLTVMIEFKLFPTLLRSAPVRMFSTVFFQLVFTWAFVIGARWWKQMTYVAADMVRPPHRTAQLNSMFKAVARDCLSLWPLVLSNCVNMEQIAGRLPWHSLSGFLLPACLATCVTAAVFALILCFALVRSVILIIVLGVVVLIVGSTATSLFLLTPTAMNGALQHRGPPHLALSWTLAGCLIGFATVLVLIVRPIYARTEWGRMR